MTSAMYASADRRRRSDVWLVLLVCAGFFGTAVFSHRPLSIHEARLPELAREMVQGTSNWLLPQSGGRPWLERPPLPHWFTALSMLIFRSTDTTWVVRLPAAIFGTSLVLSGGWMAARWFGRELGLFAGVMLATSYEIYQYATLAEDDIYLGAIAAAAMAMFVRQQWPAVRGDDELQNDRQAGGVAAWCRAFVNTRPLGTLLFFIFLGLTNLAKGPLVGVLPIGATIVVYLFINRDVRSLRHYTWLWGWLIFLVITLAWPWWAQRHYPDVVDNWRYDYLGDTNGTDLTAAHAWDEPWWYYLMVLPLALTPWSWATVVGLIASARRAFCSRKSAERFLWCWALLALLVLSAPARKHHHYLVPVLVPWGILGAIGFQRAANWLIAFPRGHWQRWAGPTLWSVIGVAAIGVLHAKVPGGAPAIAFLILVWLSSIAIFFVGLKRRDAVWLVAAIVIGFGFFAGWMQWCVISRDDRSLAELRFLKQVDTIVPPDQTVLINADGAALEFFRVQFGLRHAQHLLQNLTYLRLPDFQSPDVFVITRVRDTTRLGELGRVEELARVDPTTRQKVDADAFALFRLHFAAGVARQSQPRYIGVMQAMGRKPGPWVGDER